MTTRCPRCGATLDGSRLDVCLVCLLRAELPPALLGDSIELVEEIGRGGMGVVYKARHLRLGRIVAVKFLSEPLARDAESRKRFEREARALAMLNHPGIVAVHDFGESDGQSYIVMEHVEGRPLSELVPLPEDRARRVVAEVCDALAHAHRLGIVHRDVKPANIFVGSDGRAKIGDFGIARPMDQVAGDWAVTSTGRVAGTPRYMAPEALLGAAPDPRMDVFALGVVLYEAITGRPPAGDFEPLPGALDGVVRRALAASPSQRYASAEEMHRALVAASPGDAADLPPEEMNWLRATALLLSLATAVALWAFLLSVTPRVMAPGDVMPLVMLETERLADGRIVSWARFEIGPALGAILAFVLATLGYGLLRRHWRQAGLATRAPDRPIRESTLVLWVGLLAVTVYAGRRIVEASGRSWLSRYIPILGGLTETVALFLFWVTVLQAWRTGRPLRCERRLWAGLALALCPPVIDLLRYLLNWHP
jgi:serine/threonine-protein kinase